MRHADELATVLPLSARGACLTIDKDLKFQWREHKHKEAKRQAVELSDHEGYLIVMETNYQTLIAQLLDAAKAAGADGADVMLARGKAQISVSAWQC